MDPGEASLPPARHTPAWAWSCGEWGKHTFPFSWPASGLAWPARPAAGPLPGEALEPSGRWELSGEAPRLGLRLRPPSKGPRLGRVLATWVIHPFVQQIHSTTV